MGWRVTTHRPVDVRTLCADQHLEFVPFNGREAYVSLTDGIVRVRGVDGLLQAVRRLDVDVVQPGLAAAEERTLRRRFRSVLETCRRSTQTLDEGPGY